jgi:hypothetical protein
MAKRPVTSKSKMELLYELLVGHASSDMKGVKVDTDLHGVIELSLELLQTCVRIPLTSIVRSKTYLALQLKDAAKMSRPINAELFDINLTLSNLERVVTGDLLNLKPEVRAKVLYTAAISYCCHADLIRTGDKKTPGTFFEIFVAHLVARRFDVNPTKSIDALNLDLKTELPTDYIFSLGEGKNRIHLPVKTSTRERVIQAWAHQRVLDGVYGVGRFKGVLVCLAETNMQTQKKSVVEVCLPDQWALYQMFIAQLHRVYYMDPPEKYLPLAKKYPFIQVKHFAKFFDEADALANASPLA